MADTTKTTKELKLVAGFVDGDTRTISYPDPRANLTADEINAVKPAAEKVLIGDKNGADFADWQSAKVVENSTVYLDIG